MSLMKNMLQNSSKMMAQEGKALNPTDITYLEDMLLDENGKLIIRSYEDLKDAPQNDISLFCVRHGFYSLPTKELMDLIIDEIGDKDKSKVMEIGAGNGVYCRELGIRGVDNFMQLNPQIKNHYQENGQSIVNYDTEYIKKMDGFQAVKLYSPDIVFASWVTHKYNPQQDFRGGNQFGLDEGKMLRKIKKYIFVGNDRTHAMKPIMSKPHRTIRAEWLLSRSLEKNKNAVYIWE